MACGRGTAVPGTADHSLVLYLLFYYIPQAIINRSEAVSTFVQRYEKLPQMRQLWGVM